ncbi:MAG: response regulator [Saprospiraceae bacterium]|nr:response regulator [Saprospiraceae bacterium]
MKRILVIEDNPEVRDNLTEILELSNYKVLAAENGKEGVDIALREKPDLILCDVMMPELDGFGVLHILSKKPETADIPFIFLTAKAEKSDFRKGMNLGADDYITKPFDDVELLDALETRLRKNDRLRQSFDKTPQGLNSFINEARGFEALKKLSEDRATKTFQKKEVVFNEGEHPRQIFFVNQGKIKIYKTNEEGKEFILKVLKEGDFFGYIDLIKGTPYAESAAAMESTELSVIPKEDFFTLLHGNKDVSSKLIKMLADNVIQQEEQLLNLAYNSIRKRVAEALLNLYDRYSQQGDSKIAILRDDLASMVGTAKESVIRTLTDFKNEKLIDIDSGIITIRDKKRLEQLPN